MLLPRSQWSAGAVPAATTTTTLVGRTRTGVVQRRGKVFRSDVDGAPGVATEMDHTVVAMSVGISSCVRSWSGRVGLDGIGLGWVGLQSSILWPTLE